MSFEHPPSSECMKLFYEKVLCSISQKPTHWAAEKQQTSKFDPHEVQKILQKMECTKPQRIFNEFIHEGPLTHLLKDEEVDEILIIDKDTLCYEKKGSLHHLKDRFLSEHSYQRFVDNWTSSFMKSLSFENPTGNGRHKGFRVHAIAPPLSANIQLSLRRIGGHKFTSLEALYQCQMLDTKSLAICAQLLEGRKNILISGATSSGKTTFMQCLINNLKNERLLILEDSAELICPNPMSTSLCCPSRTEQYIQAFEMKDLVKESLRMRPDRIILGEARSSEAKDYIQALSTGHTGCLASIHAHSAQDALLRLECLILMGASNWNTQITKRLISNAIDYVIQIEKRPETNQRILKSIHQLSGLEENQILLDPVYQRSS